MAVTQKKLFPKGELMACPVTVKISKITPKCIIIDFDRSQCSLVVNYSSSYLYIVYVLKSVCSGYLELGPVRRSI